MKKSPSFFLIFIVLIITPSFFSCQPSYLVRSNNDKKIDNRLVGKWGGSEQDNQVQGLKKEWVMTRTANGKFSLEFRAIENGEVDSWIEVGNWWVEDGKFHEYHENSGKTDVYDYEVLNEDQIKFTAFQIDIPLENPEYTFIDKRVK